METEWPRRDQLSADSVVESQVNSRESSKCLLQQWLLLPTLCQLATGYVHKLSRMSSSSCTRFKQNAWKKDLCSNCYRPKEEHQPVDRPRLPKLYIPLKPPSQGILNLGGKNCSPSSPSKSKGKKKCVRFTKEESEIIGYDGGDTDEEEDDVDEDSCTNWSGQEFEESGDDERALERLTRTNTDFNSVLSNLSTKPSCAPPLLLGAKHHHKQTLQVSIQPFGSGSPATCNSIAASRKSHLHKLLEDEQSKQPSLLVLSSSPDENDDPLREQTVQQEQKERKKSGEEHLLELVPIKAVFIESTRKEERGNPEGRKTHIQRGNVITKSHEQVKNKLYIQNIAQKEKRSSLLQDKTNESEDLKTLIIRTNGPDFEDPKNVKNLDDGGSRNEILEDNVPAAPVLVQPTTLKIESEVTVKVLKLLDGEHGPAESREMAGEPDGKADSDEPETPLSPPPRASFLHRDAKLSQLGALHSPPPTSPLSLALGSALETKAASPAHSPAATSPSLPTTPPPYCEPASSGGSSPISGDLPSSPGLLLARCKRPAPKPPTPELQQSPPPLPPPPEPVPRQRRGSTEAVLATLVMAATPGGTVTEKKKTRVRQTLKKLLRLGREDEVYGNSSKDEDHQQGQPHVRPRPHIIHPLDLNKSGVQVLPPQSATAAEKSSPDTVTTPTTSPFTPTARPGKPPPPPRSESLNLMERLRPSPNSENNVYANLGENRCGITPVKPQRTGSLRDQSSVTPVKLPMVPAAVVVANLPDKPCAMVQQTDTDHVYECVGVSSAPECDMDRHRTSLQYSSAGSETESDIYYPYVTFQNGECQTKLKRRERGAVHSTLEENYGAVIVANYEALFHLLSQRKERKPTSCAQLDSFIRNPSWSQVRCTEEPSMKLDSVTYLIGSLGEDCQEVTLAVSKLEEINLPADLQPLVTFSDSIPSVLLGDGVELQNYNISVLGRMKMERLSDYATKLERSAEAVREGVLVLLQAVEHMVSCSHCHYNPDNFVTYTRHGECTPKATYIPPNKKVELIEVNNQAETLQTLCNQLLADLPLGKIISSIKEAKEARSLLQSWLWGPTVLLAPQALRRWLDLERATFLHGLVCSSTPVQDPATDLHLKFLVESDIQDIAIATTQLLEASNNTGLSSISVR
ncbi:uncharacterized protein isoform X4 [Rhodnius prolixus]